MERQITSAPKSHNLTNSGVWSPDSQWIVYDTRHGEKGADFDGTSIEAVNVETGEVVKLYESENDAHCGVVTCHPKERRVAFILGPEHPTPDWQYGFSHRQGVIVDWANRGKATPLDARDLVPPFTPGALRGGSHVHVWDAAGEWLSFTYNDAILESDIRDICVGIPGRAVKVASGHERNHPGEFFSVVVSRTTPNPKLGSDEIMRACEEAWIGERGYIRHDGSKQRHALAFQGTLVTDDNQPVVEVFVADLPEDLTQLGEGPLAGTPTHRPFPPKNVTQRRLTFTANRKYPGLQGPRHWLRGSPDGSRIACLMKDDAAVVQLWTVSPANGKLLQLTFNSHSVSSAFTWSPDGANIAHAMDNSIFLTDTMTGESRRMTDRVDDASVPLPEACVFSPDGKKIAFMRRTRVSDLETNQICVAFVNINAIALIP